MKRLDPTRFRLRAASLALLLSAGMSAAAEPPAAGSFAMEVDGGLVTLSANAAPLLEVVRAMGDAAGFEVNVRGDVAVPITASLTRVPVADALQRMLRKANVIFVSQGRENASGAPVPDRLLLLGTGAAVTGPVTVQDGSSAVEGADPAAERTHANSILRLANSAGTGESLERLTEAVWADRAPLARSRAAMALGALGDERAVPALERALADDEPSVRTQAIHALGQIGGERAVRALGEVVLRESADRTERMRAARALGRLDGDLARSFLGVAASDADPLVADAATQAPEPAPDGPTPKGEQRGSFSLR